MRAPVSPDLGTPGYGIGLNQTWYRRTISHNTVLIDGLSQPPNEGRLNRFDGSGEEGFQIADASVSWAEGSYKGVHMRRVILMKTDPPSHPPSPKGSALYFIDLFAVTCDRPRQIDWVFRFKGVSSARCQVPGADVTRGTRWSGERLGGWRARAMSTSARSGPGRRPTGRGSPGGSGAEGWTCFWLGGPSFSSETRRSTLRRSGRMWSWSGAARRPRSSHRSSVFTRGGPMSKGCGM
ncbi:MAG: hypothetical protein EXS64_21350 [Candidatus Latescibacteria bacterium]|nr:hypothetical protein [Candidatus Latescibacterota bacterium]